MFSNVILVSLLGLLVQGQDASLGIAQAKSKLGILNSVSTSVQKSLDIMKNSEYQLKNATDALLSKERKLELLTSSIPQNDVLSDPDDPFNQCLKEVNPVEIISEQITDEVRRCISVGLTENSNLITSTLAEAQTFMELPNQIAEDLNQCGLAQDCLIRISNHAIKESFQSPSKVLVLAARIQQLAYRSLARIDGCAVDALTKIGQQGIGIVQDVQQCMKNKKLS